MLFGSFLNFLGRFPKSVTNHTKKQTPNQLGSLFDVAKTNCSAYQSLTWLDKRLLHLR